MTRPQSKPGRWKPFPPVHDGHRPDRRGAPFMQMGLADYARDALTRSGTVGVAMMGRKNCCNVPCTVSDFPELLTGAGNRVWPMPTGAPKAP